MRKCLPVIGVVVTLTVSGCMGSDSQASSDGGADFAFTPLAADLSSDCGPCAGDAPLCDVGSRRCVACLGVGDCPMETVCREGRCVPGCSPTHSGCGDAGSCEFDAGTCHWCRSDSECGGMTPACDLDTGRCFPCTPRSDKCPGGRYCAIFGDTFLCMLGCKDSGDCVAKLGASGHCCLHACVDVMTTWDNCGQCSASCLHVDCCNGLCTSKQADGSNCGSCGIVCPRNRPRCLNGVCES